MPTILTVDDIAIIREPLTQALRGAGYEAIGASSGEEALAKLISSAPDVVLLDLQMPGIGGLGVLKAMRGYPATAKIPVILLTSASDRETVLAAAKFGVSDYVLKSRFDIKELLGRIAKHLPTAPGPQAPTAAIPAPTGAQTVVAAPAVALPAAAPQTSAAPPVEASAGKPVDPEVTPALEGVETMRRIAGAEVKALSGAVADLIALTASPRATLNEVAACLKRDPPLSARLLRVSNSAAYASKRVRIATVEDAIKHVGLAEVNRVAASIGIMENFGGGTASAKFIRHWQHGLAVATLMERLCVEHEAAPGLAHTVGLCQRLPAIMVHQLFLEQEDHVQELARQAGGPVGPHYQTMLGIPFERVAKQLLTRTGLPEIMMLPLQEFFAASTAQRAAMGPLARLLKLANGYVNGLMLSTSTHDEVMPFERSSFRAGEHLVEHAGPDAIELRAHAASLTAATAGLTSEQMAALSESPFPQRSLRVTYLRDLCFSAFDPLEAMLGLMVSPLVVTTDPAEVEPDPSLVDAIVIAAPNPPGPGVRALVSSAMQRGVRVLLLTPSSARPEPGSLPLPTTPYAVQRFLAGESTVAKRAA